MTLTGTIAHTADLAPRDMGEMYALMRAYFADVGRRSFEEDLYEKPWVLLLRDRDVGTIHGFSTLCLMEETVQATPVSAIFSGDTIIDRPYWGSLEMERVWLHFVFARIAEHPQRRWFWFLICKGYRTYRFLPVFFHHYYPSPEATPGFERAVLRQLGRQRFADRFNPRTSVIRCPDDYRLRPGVGDIGPRELQDSRIAFFQRCNPGWAAGDELACLAEISLDNLKGMAHRLLGREAV